MTTNKFTCQICNYEFIISRRIIDDLPSECPKCKGTIVQEYDPQIIVMPNVTTFGQIAERNNKRNPEGAKNFNKKMEEYTEKMGPRRKKL